VSSLNHHVSIVKLTVHKHYLSYLRTGECVEDGTDAEWSIPVMMRSKWYDLFHVEDRLEAIKVIWGIMGYLARTD
jgi:hypothetical protein